MIAEVSKLVVKKQKTNNAKEIFQFSSSLLLYIYKTNKSDEKNTLTQVYTYIYICLCIIV